jgi:gluconate 2-dehydrogenase alpha chain
MPDVTMKSVDAVIIGFGWTGAIMAKELTEAGLKVVALERGPNRDTYPEGAYPKSIDELTHNSRHALFQDMSKSTMTIRHKPDDQAAPYRKLAAFLPGTGVGGSGLHWSGCHWRITPEELRMRSHYEERYGKAFIPGDMTLQDWGVTYEELEPHFTFAEQVFGTAGQAYKVNGKVVGQGNPFDADRSTEFPLPPMRNTYSAELFRKAAAEAGYHPFCIPSANASAPYTNPMAARWPPARSAASALAMPATTIRRLRRT